MPDVLMGAGDLVIGKPHDAAETSSGQFSLTNAARAWTKTWAMLCAMGWKPGPISRSSPLVRVSFKFGTGSYIGGLISNPQFFEHVMGWPIGWSAPGAPVTEYAAWLQRSRTELSRLISLRAEGLPDA